LPDSQAGYFRGFELRTFFTANNDQDDSSDQRQATEDWRNRKVLLIFPGRVDRPNVQNLFLTRVGESLISERQPTENNQENSNPNDRFHANYSAG
jgi:hypothetical protein